MLKSIPQFCINNSHIIASSHTRLSEALKQYEIIINIGVTGEESLQHVDDAVQASH